MNRKVLLAVLAHPDDESFGSGGTLAYYARQDVDVYLICATGGEAGEIEEQYLAGYNSVSELREAELRCAVKILGLKAVFNLGYRDSGMPGSEDNRHPKALAAQPVDQVAADVRKYINLVKPQVVITHDPIGGYHHPDHIAVHKATVKAFEWTQGESSPDSIADYQPQKLYFQTFHRSSMRAVLFFLKLLGQDTHHFGRNRDIDLEAIASVSFPIHARINYRSVAHIRDEASRCHASQGGGAINKGPLALVRRLLSLSETFMRAVPLPVNRHVENDLFEGVILPESV